RWTTRSSTSPRHASTWSRSWWRRSAPPWWPKEPATSRSPPTITERSSAGTAGAGGELETAVELRDLTSTGNGDRLGRIGHVAEKRPPRDLVAAPHEPLHREAGAGSDPSDWHAIEPGDAQIVAGVHQYQPEHRLGPGVGHLDGEGVQRGKLLFRQERLAG